jgi:HSP20 family protein
MLQAWDPFTVLAQLDEDFDELVRRTWGSATSGRLALGYVPPVDMFADGKDVVIRLELPGVDVDKDVEINVEDATLTISGSRRQEITESGNGDRALVRELHQGSFWRQFALPSGVQPSDISATYDKGILSVRVRDVIKRGTAHKVAIGKGNGASQITAKGNGSK